MNRGITIAVEAMVILELLVVPVLVVVTSPPVARPDADAGVKNRHQSRDYQPEGCRNPRGR